MGDTRPDRGAGRAVEVPGADRPAAVERALRFIRAPETDRFEEVALEVFRHQFETCGAYRRFCESQGRGPARVTDWQEIPCVPAAAFKELELATAPPRHVFLTSGTTRSNRRGRHALPALDLYGTSWVEPFRSHVLPDRERMGMVSLVPPWEALPGSSLSYMVTAIVTGFAADITWGLGPRGLDLSALEAALERAERSGEPVLILTTALAAAGWLDRLEGAGRRFRLPPGSRVMDTGGPKGRTRAAAREELLAGYRDRLGIEAGFVVGEYGMTELCSQFYETALVDTLAGRAPPGRDFEGPAWVRTRVLDPETLAPAPGSGLLAHLDLANAWTVSAILTEDLGVRTGRGFRLLGRASGAELRGCSLDAEEIMNHDRD